MSRRASRLGARILWVSLLVWALPSLAWAACTGTDLFRDLRSEDPIAHGQILAEAAKVENGIGNFWRVEREGIAPSHILGTFHSPEVVPFVGGHIWQALDSARVLALEYSLGDVDDFAQRMETDPSLIYDDGAAFLADVLAPTEYVRLLRHLEERRMSLLEIEQMRPWMLFFYLSTAPCETEPGYGDQDDLDYAISRRAAAAGIAEVGLEAIDQVPEHFEGFVPADMVRVFIHPEAFMDKANDALMTGVAFYRREQTAASEAWADWIGEAYSVPDEVESIWKQLRVRLVDDRNHAWMPGLEKHLRGGNAFVAIGVGHLPGENGLIALLRAQGWTVTRMPFASK